MSFGYLRLWSLPLFGDFQSLCTLVRITVCSFNKNFAGVHRIDFSLAPSNYVILRLMFSLMQASWAQTDGDIPHFLSFWHLPELSHVGTLSCQRGWETYGDVYRETGGIVWINHMRNLIQAHRWKLTEWEFEFKLKHQYFFLHDALPNIFAEKIF